MDYSYKKEFFPKNSLYSIIRQNVLTLLAVLLITVLGFYASVYYFSDPLVFNPLKGNSVESKIVTRQDVKENIKNFRKWTNYIEKLNPKQDNLGKAYGYAGKALKPTEEVQDYFLDHPNAKANGKGLVVAARFWREIDRTIGDTDDKAIEVYDTYLMLRPHGEYAGEANKWIRSKTSVSLSGVQK
jgi:hypothetical protein